MSGKPDLCQIAPLQQETQKRTGEFLELAEGHFSRSIPRPDLRFDLRGKTAGQVRTRDGRTWIIRFNLALLVRNQQDFLDRTVPHEAAHVAAFHLFGPRIRPHGAEWQAVMRLFGADPERCHDYDVEGLQTRRLSRFHYRCACRSHQLTSIRHNRVRAGQIYLCRQCGQALAPAAD